jgi:hypothetical protein
MFGRAYVPKRIILRRAAINLFRMDDPEFEKRENEEAEEKAVTPPDMPHH